MLRVKKDVHAVAERWVEDVYRLQAGGLTLRAYAGCRVDSCVLFSFHYKNKQ